MGLLDGGIQSLFGTAFAFLYLPGTLTRVLLTDNGKGGGSLIPSSQPCRVQVDTCTEAMRQQAGYTDTDVRLLILQAGVTGGAIDTDCTVTVDSGPLAGKSFAVAFVTQDPASSYWECRAQRVPDPE